MIVNLDELNFKDVIEFEYNVKKDNELDERILDLKNTFCKGTISKNSIGEYILNCTLEGEMYLEDSITLESVPYKFSCEIEENVTENTEISQNTLDLKQILWQNIVLEVPISFTKVLDARLKGNGWELNGEEKVDSCDPRLEKLKDLLKGDD